MEQLAGTKYTVVRKLGEGGMGTVYQVVKQPNIQGVLKLMNGDLTVHEDLRVRFFDEVRILAQLEHPNIVRVFDYDALPDGTPFYVMELLNGRTVRDVLHAVGRVPPRVAYEITRQLLEALQCAHTNEIPVIHRDIKPENIFLHSPRHGDPAVKLIDFGVSSLGDRKHDSQFVGTWGYAAPEQIRGELPTPATDLYAVGLVLYEMLAGRGPFDHHPDWKMLSIAQLEEIPAPVSQFAPWVPASIVQLIASVLAKDPNDRPRDAYAFAERLYDLENAKDGRAPLTQPGHAPLEAVLAQLESAKTPSTPDVVIRPEFNRSAPHEEHGPTTPRAAALVRGPVVHDTFASQHSDARPATRSRLGFIVLAGALLFAGFTIATAIIVRGKRPPPAPAATPPAEPVSVAAPLPSVAPVASIASSAAPPATPSVPVPVPVPIRAPAAKPSVKPAETGRTDFVREP